MIYYPWSGGSSNQIVWQPHHGTVSFCAIFAGLHHSGPLCTIPSWSRLIPVVWNHFMLQKCKFYPKLPASIEFCQPVSTKCMLCQRNLMCTQPCWCARKCVNVHQSLLFKNCPWITGICLNRCVMLVCCRVQFEWFYAEMSEINSSGEKHMVITYLLAKGTNIRQKLCSDRLLVMFLELLKLNGNHIPSLCHHQIPIFFLESAPAIFWAKCVRTASRFCIQPIICQMALSLFLPGQALSSFLLKCP